jgi:hypothetical protein
VISTLINRPCTITRRLAEGDEDGYGSDRAAETELETVCELQQARRDEGAAHADLSQTTWLLFFRPGVPLRSGDAVTVEGETYEIIGDPWVARDPLTRRDSHVEATARRTVSSDDEVGS